MANELYTQSGPFPIHDHLPGQSSDDGLDRRRDRRHDLAPRGVEVCRWDGFRDETRPLGTLLDLSAGGVRLECAARDVEGITAASHMRVKLVLPDAAGISPFVHADAAAGGLSMEPANAWTGWLEVARVTPLGHGRAELGGRLLDMADLDRGMLKLYLSVHPIAA